MYVIKLRAQDRYSVPRFCCVCESPAGSDTLTAEDVSWGRTIITLPFPLCPACAGIQARAVRRNRIGCASGLGASALLCIAGIAITMVTDVTPGTTLNLILGILFILSAVTFLVTGVVIFIMSQEPSYKKVRRAVRITGHQKGWKGKETITVSFANDRFAEQFKELNSALVLEVQKR